jgi:hypothetical protein
MHPLPPRYYNRLREKPGAPYPPLQEQPGFSLVHPGPPGAGLRELRPNGVLGSPQSTGPTPMSVPDPHACLNGYVYLGYTAVDEETGEVLERVEALPCRWCADGR